MSIMAVMMTVVMPVWKQTAQREKEEELVFRGKQYVHAIGLFQRKFANAYPPNIDVLVDQRFLRKKFKDPITNDDFVPIPAGQAAPGTQRAGRASAAPGTTGATGRGQPADAASPRRAARAPAARASTPIARVQAAAGGISGVTSKSKDQSIRLYNGRGHYNEWAFVYIQQQQAPGAGAPGTARPVSADSGSPVSNRDRRFPAAAAADADAAVTRRTRAVRAARRPSVTAARHVRRRAALTPVQPPPPPRGRF